MQPFSREFNAAVHVMADKVCPCGYDLAPNAPTNLADLVDWIERTGRIAVVPDNSDETIFGDASEKDFNYDFRAWHDWTHYHIRADFNLIGETRVAMQQIADLAKIYGTAFADKYKPLILAEVIGQALHNELLGCFPKHQRLFDNNFLAPFNLEYGYGGTFDYVRHPSTNN